MQRPKRIQIINEYGKKQTLPEGERYFQDLGGCGKILFLGLGPSAADAEAVCPEAETIYYVECPKFEKQLNRNLPAKFKKISASKICADEYRIRIYTPARKFFPSFWNPLIAGLTLSRSNLQKRQCHKSIWISGDENSLLIPELTRAFSRADFTYRVIAPDAMRKDLLSLLEQEVPEIVLSINFTGLDTSGEIYTILREAGVKVAVWFVDNPFHIISGIKSNYWKELPLMVTDHWFLPHLKRLGAVKTTHLPLATDPAIFNQDIQKYPQLHNRTVFVGRSSFPSKDSFFAGCSFSVQERQDACDAIKAGIKPDFEWWSHKDGLTKFWPGYEVRSTGYKAEESGLMWRCASLQNAGEKLTLFGDDGWRQYLDKPDLRAQVDYYTATPSIYAGADITLNMTSPLLPCGLTQRNFDVWAAGGFLLTDRTKGLSIFPEALIDECSFSKPDDIPALCDKFRSTPQLKKRLSKIWQKVIMEQHTYKNRINTILNFLH